MIEKNGGSISLYIGNDLLEKLKQLSVDEDRSVSKLICNFVRDGFRGREWRAECRKSHEMVVAENCRKLNEKARL